MSTIIELSGPEKAPLSDEPAKQLIILLHGLGSDGNDLIGLVPAMCNYFPYANFIAPNAPFPCDMAPSGYQWFSLQDRSAAPILTGAQYVAPILDHFITQQQKRFGLDDQSTALVGFSQGTMMSLHAGLRRKESLGGILGYSGALVAPKILGKEIRSKPSVCLIHGTGDDVVPFEQLTEAKEMLTSCGVEVETHTRHGLGHSIDEYGLEAGVRFLQGCLL